MSLDQLRTLAHGELVEHVSIATSSGKAAAIRYDASVYV
jgi:hypothetical protein